MATPTRPARDLMAATLWIAITTGLVEAAGAMILLSAGQLTGVWWDLFWVSPLFDVLMFSAVGLVLSLVARILGRDPLDLVLPAYGFLTASICLGLALPYQVHIAALLLLSAGLGVQAARLAKRHRVAALALCRRTLPAVLGSWAVAFAVLQVGRPLRERIETSRLPDAPSDAANVVLVVIDALRADHLPMYGYGRNTSPTLSRLAAEGASFGSAFSTSPYTAPSHASLLTGLLPVEHGVQWIERRPVLSGEHATLPEVLRPRGYRTAAISANRFWFTREQGFGRGFMRFEDNDHSLADAFTRTAYGRKLEEIVVRRAVDDYPWRLRGERVTDAALEWVAGDSIRPFFLMLNYFDVHDPYLPPDPYRGWFAGHASPGGILNSYQDRYHAELTAAEVQEEIDAYDGAIVYVDREIERLLAGLEALGALDEALVIVTSDHGEAFGEHGAYIHANSVYLEEIHVPLLLWSPGRVPAGFRSDWPVSNAAVAATIVDLMGAEGVPSFRSAPLSGLWVDGRLGGRGGWPVSEMEHWPWSLDTSPSHSGAARSVVSPEYHYIRHDSLGVELYRWRADTRETTNLVLEDSTSAAVAELAGVLDALRP